MSESKDITRRPELNLNSMWSQVGKITQYLKDNVWLKPKEKKE